MGWIWRKRADGSRRLGFVPAFGFGLLAFAALTWTFRDYVWPQKTIVRPRPSDSELGKRVKVDGYATSAAEMGRRGLMDTGPQQNQGSQSDRGVAAGQDRRGSTDDRQGTSASTVSAFESMNAAVKQAKSQTGDDPSSRDEHARLDEGGSIQVRREGDMLPPTGRPGNQGASNTAQSSRPDLSKLIHATGGQIKVAGTGQAVDKPGAAKTTETVAHGVSRPTVYLPRGEKFPVYLLDRVETGDLASFVELGVAKTVYFNGRPVIPFGAKLIAGASKEGTRDRIQFTITAIRFLNGVEVPLTGIAKDSDGATGVRGYYIPPPTMVQMAPFLTDFLRNYLELVAQSNGTARLQVAGLNLQVQPGVGDQAKSQALEATSQAVSDFAKKQMTELERRYEAHLVIPPGIKFDVQLTSLFDAASINGGASPNAATPPTPLPVRPEGSEASPIKALLSTATLAAGEVKSSFVAPRAPVQETNTKDAAPAETAPASASDFFGTAKP